MSATPIRPRSVQRRLGLLQLAAVVTLTACSASVAQYGMDQSINPRAIGPREYGPLDVELNRAAHLGVFRIDDLVSLWYPPVPLSRTVTRFPFERPPGADETVPFLAHHGLSDPDSVPDPLEGEPLANLFEAGQHVLYPPLRTYNLTRMRYDEQCDERFYLLLVASADPLDFTGLTTIQDTYAANDPWLTAEEILEAMGLADEREGWSARLYPSGATCSGGRPAHLRRIR